MLLIFFKAFVIGFSIAMPVGPIGLLCIKNTLNRGFGIGFATGIGAALADSFYGFLAGGGLAFLSRFLINHNFIIKIIGGLFLIYLGFIEIKHRNLIAKKEVKVKTGDFLKTISSVFFLTLTNPATIVSFIAIFAALGNFSQINNLFLMIAGVFIGSISWWIVLTSFVNKVRHKISQNIMIKIRILSGVIIFSFGIYALIQGFELYNKL